MSEFFNSPADPRPGDRFHLSQNCIHADGEVVCVEPARNACGKLGHIVIWRAIGTYDDRRTLYRITWSSFKEYARRLPPLAPAAGTEGTVQS